MIGKSKNSVVLDLEENNGTLRKLKENAHLCGDALGHASTGCRRPFSRHLMDSRNTLGKAQIL
jgi:hypothetical protein